MVKDQALSEQLIAVMIRERGMISNGLLVEDASVYIGQTGQIDRPGYLVGSGTASACLLVTFRCCRAGREPGNEAIVGSFS